MKPLWKTHHLCRACRTDLVEVLSLGDLKLNAFPDTPTGHLLIPSAPLTLMACPRCTLVQLRETVDQDLLYRHYWYRSSVNETMIAELQSIVLDGATRLRGRGLSKPRVLDIGANDGTLLSCYPPNWFRVGVDPAMNLQETLGQSCNLGILDYFPTPRLSGYQFDLITAIACSYDLEDPVRFFQEIRNSLAPGGWVCVQFQDLLQQIRSHAFDNICHEHLEYYSLISLGRVVARAGLSVVDCEQRAINGGSLRVWLQAATEITEEPARIGAPEPVYRQYLKETAGGLDHDHLVEVLHQFKWDVSQTLLQIKSLLLQCYDEGWTIHGYGASTKGNITLQLLGLGPADIPQVIDRSPAKEGKFTVTGIPIVGEEKGREDPAEVWFALAWQFKESILRREGEFLQGGGRIVFPLPMPEVVQQAGVLERKRRR